MPLNSKSLSIFLRKTVATLKKKSNIAQPKSRKYKFFRALLISLSVLIIMVGLVILFISPIAKYLVEKYDLKYTGRQITMDWAFVNPFTGYVHFNNVNVHELESDSVFLSIEGVNANFALFKMFSGTYEISELTLNEPRGTIIQIDSNLNFDDLIVRFSKKVDSVKAVSAVHFNMLNIKIVDGEFYYRERVTPINYFITKVNIESTGLLWDTDTIDARFSFLSGIGGGGMKGKFIINIKNLDFRLAVVAEKFDLNIMEQYLRELTNFGYFTGNIDADLKVTGNFKTAENVSFSGPFAINDLRTGEKPGDDYASFRKLTLAIIELSPNKHKYLFDSVSLNNPYFKYERYDYLDNLTRMFVSDESINAVESPNAKFNLVLEIGNYIKRLSQNFFRSNYKINRLAIYSGDLEFSDYSMSEKFNIHLNPLNVLADSIIKSKSRVGVSIQTGIKPYGNASVLISINPNDSSDFDLNYTLQKLPVAMFNPYLIQFTSFPVDRGTLSANGTWNVRNGNIKSNNHIVLIDPRLTKREQTKDIKRLPMRLIMAFTRERGNVIDYEVPISGDLKDPKFHLRDVIVDILGNIFVKPATTPYRMEVKSTETEIEKSLTLKWEIRGSSLTRQQENFIERMADFLHKNPEATITVSPQQFSVKEKEYIMLYEAKKKYFMTTESKDEKYFSREDAEKVDNMSIKDEKFVKYLNRQTADSMLFTTQDKCNRLLGATFVEAKYNQLNREREAIFISFFKDRNVEKRVKISANQSVIPYNGFSFYKMQYKGEFPEALMKAYQRMNELNDKAPRNLFRKQRTKYKEG
jgi:hypothetical protein